MIIELRCNQTSFKTVVFNTGFNVILADRTKDSTKKDSRNGLGKSNLIEIIHFCLGASTRKGKGLLVEPLKGWMFTLDLLLNDKVISVSRSTGDPSKVSLEGDFAGWSIKPRYDGILYKMSVSDWNKVLGECWFGLKENLDKKFKPSFRSLISYFARRGNGAFLSPFEYFPRQTGWDKQISNAYLLGLSWEEASNLQNIKEQEKTLDQLKKATGSGILNNVLGSIGELEARKIRIEMSICKQEDELKTFRVHPQYKELEEEANRLTYEIHSLVNENITDQKLVKYYEDSFSIEKEPYEDTLRKIFDEAKIKLPGMVKKHLGEVEVFHKQIVINRRSFLQEELEQLRNRVQTRDNEIQNKSNIRANTLSILSNHGALDEFLQLQDRHSKSMAQYNDIEQKIENIKKFEKGKSSLRIEKELILQRAQNDYEDRKQQRQKAITLFNANSEALYSAPGKLLIDFTKNGYKYDVNIERSNSQGIGHMKVFCYDLMLAQLWNGDASPNFLIHDSTIFDGVDERQVALALELAHRESIDNGFQYICMLNSDDIPWQELNPEFDINSFVRQRFTDETEDGGLLGIRF